MLGKAPGAVTGCARGRFHIWRRDTLSSSLFPRFYLLYTCYV